MNEKMCITCYEPITNPVCEWCYMKQISSWLEHAGMKNEKREKIISSLKESFTPELPTGNTCVLCGKEEVKICSYCFFVKIGKEMKKIKLSEHLVQSFFADFNYHVEKEDEFMSLIK